MERFLLVFAFFLVGACARTANVGLLTDAQSQSASSTAAVVADLQVQCIIQTAACSPLAASAPDIVDALIAGTYSDTYLDEYKTQAGCFKRGGEFYAACGSNQPVTASYLINGNVVAHQAAGPQCKIKTASCPAFASYPTNLAQLAAGKFFDTYNNSNLTQDACLQRAADYATWCDGTESVQATWLINGVTKATKISGPFTPLYREYNSKTGQHRLYSILTGLSSPYATPGFKIEGTVSNIYKTQSFPTLVELYRCVVSSPALYFTSIRSDCEVYGAQIDQVLGWINTVQQSGEVPLYRFAYSATGDSLDTISSAEGTGAGYSLNGILGYVPK